MVGLEPTATRKSEPGALPLSYIISLIAIIATYINSVNHFLVPFSKIKLNSIKSGFKQQKNPCFTRVFEFYGFCPDCSTSNVEQASDSFAFSSTNSCRSFSVAMISFTFAIIFSLVGGRLSQRGAKPAVRSSNPSAYVGLPVA